MGKNSISLLYLLCHSFGYNLYSSHSFLFYIISLHRKFQVMGLVEEDASHSLDKKVSDERIDSKIVELNKITDPKMLNDEMDKWNVQKLQDWN
jgi:hypothetical protein